MGNAVNIVVVRIILLEDDQVNIPSNRPISIKCNTYLVELYTTIKHAIFYLNSERSDYNPPCWQITAQFLQMADENQHEGRRPPQPSRCSRAPHEVGSCSLLFNISFNRLMIIHLFDVSAKARLWLASFVVVGRIYVPGWTGRVTPSGWPTLLGYVSHTGPAASTRTLASPWHTPSLTSLATSTCLTSCHFNCTISKSFLNKL